MVNVRSSQIKSLGDRIIKTPQTGILVEPLYGYSRDGHNPYTPTLKEVIYELFDSINFIKYPQRISIFTAFMYHLFSFVAFLVYFTNFFSLKSFLFGLTAVYFIAQIYNTFWFHRYCSHRAFKFSNQGWTRFFLFTNPLFLRDEIYAIPHHIHHSISEKIGDPYGPHLGWLGCYFGIESSQKFNPEISEEQFDKYKKIVAHIGFPLNNFYWFVKMGSFENIGFFYLRAIIAQLIWISIAYSLGGFAFIWAWYAAVFFTHALIRDFNWRGHGGVNRGTKLGIRDHTGKRARQWKPVNQPFYGYLASEWHENHHKFPSSANNQILKSEPDVVFMIVKLLKRVGIIKEYNNWQNISFVIDSKLPVFAETPTR